MLFPDTETVPIAPGAVLFRGAVASQAVELLKRVNEVIAQSPLRQWLPQWASRCRLR